MLTVKEVSRISGVSVRTLHYYDEIGLLTPSGITDARYRLYDDTALERLSQILFFRELAFSLKEIKEILDSPSFDRREALASHEARPFGALDCPGSWRTGERNELYGFKRIQHRTNRGI